MGVTQGYNGFIYNLFKKYYRLVEKQLRGIKTGVKTDFVHIDDVLCRFDSKLSTPGLSS